MALFSKNKSSSRAKVEEKESKQSDKEIAQNEVEQVLPSSPSLPKGGDGYSYQVIKAPHITEKGSILGGQNKYLFKVAEGANRTEIGRAIQNLYKVEVNKVNILHMPSKNRIVGRYKGKKIGFKKAVVTLKEGSKIDLAS